MIDENELIKFLTQKTKDIQLQNGFNLWLKNVKVSKRNGTFDFYKYLLARLLKQLNLFNVNSFHQITSEIILNLINFYQQQGLSNNTIKKYLTGLKTVVNYLVECDFISSPNFILPHIKETKPQIEIIEEYDIQKILEYLNNSNDNQMKLAFMLFLTTGIRRTELINITIKSIDLKNNVIHLPHTKNGYPRDIFIIDETKQLIIDNMSKFKDQEFLFTKSNENKQATTSLIDFYFYKIKRDLDIKILSPHKLRHTYATHLILNGADLNTVRLLLGHTSFEMTQRYIDFKSKHLEQINRKCNPIKKLKKIA